MFDKAFVLNQLNQGRSIQEIGDQFAAMMNEAMTEYTAAQEQVRKRAEAEKLRNEKVRLAREFGKLVVEYAGLCGIPAEIVGTPEDVEVDELIAALDGLMDITSQVVQHADKMNKIVPFSKGEPRVIVEEVPITDDEKLRQFLAQLNLGK